MFVTTAQLTTSIHCARDVAQAYRLNTIAHDDPQRSVDHLLALYGGDFRKPAPTIVEVDIDFRNSPVYSAVVMKADGAIDIVIAKGLNFCWRRFVITKELFHGLLDKDEFHNMDLFGHLEQVLASFPDENSRPIPSVASEVLSEMATMEFLFPYEKRLQELANASGMPNFANIAQKYRIPRVKVEKFLSPDYMEKLKDI